MNFDRIITIQDTRGADGRLIVERGAVGTIRSRNQGIVGVLFDQGQDVFIEPGYNGRLFREVEFVNTTTHHGAEPIDEDWPTGGPCPEVWGDCTPKVPNVK